MRKITLRFVFTVAIFAMGCASSGEKTETIRNFRDVRWEMTVLDVKAAEDWVLKHDYECGSGERCLEYEGQISGKFNDIDCVLLYKFESGRLSSGSYVIKPRNNLYAKMRHEHLIEMLTDEYGDPTHSDKDEYKWFEPSKDLQVTLAVIESNVRRTDGSSISSIYIIYRSFSRDSGARMGG